MQLYLIRHPQPQIASGICYGRSDLPLADSASDAANRLRPQLPDGIPIFTSPLQRCRLVAEALHPEPVIDPRLQEMNFGDWEMQPWQTISRAALDAWAADPLGYCAPNGESVTDLAQRVRDFFAHLKQRNLPNAALVGHAGVMKVIVGDARRLQTPEWMRLKFGFGELLRVEV